MSGRVRDLPHIKKVTNLRPLLRGVVAAARVVRPIFWIAGRDMSSFDRKVAEFRDLEQQASAFEVVPDRFNELFGDRGWITYEWLSFDLAKTCIAKAEAGDIDGAEQDLVEHFTPETIRWKLMAMQGIRAFRPRLALAEKARVDYAEGRYYASVLVTLSLLDGLVNDLHRRRIGFFAQDVELTAWDSMSAHSGGLERLSRLMQEPRQKTRTEVIKVPYRHGIVHGRDLGYDNKMVAAKSWAALFAVRDWALKAEQQKLDEPAPTQAPSLWETLRKHGEWRKEHEILQQRLAAWRPRDLDAKEYPRTCEPSDIPEGTPERVAVDFFDSLRRGNYGRMVSCLSSAFIGETPIKRLAGDFRNRFAGMQVDHIELWRVVDVAPAITEVTARLRGTYRGESFDRDVPMRVGYYGGQVDMLPRGAEGGSWRLVFLPAIPSDPVDEDVEETA